MSPAHPKAIVNPPRQTRLDPRARYASAAIGGTGVSGIERERTSRAEKEEDVDDEFK